MFTNQIKSSVSVRTYHQTASLDALNSVTSAETADPKKKIKGILQELVAIPSEVGGATPTQLAKIIPLQDEAIRLLTQNPNLKFEDLSPLEQQNLGAIVARMQESIRKVHKNNEALRGATALSGQKEALLKMFPENGAQNKAIRTLLENIDQVNVRSMLTLFTLGFDNINNKYLGQFRNTDNSEIDPQSVIQVVNKEGGYIPNGSFDQGEALKLASLLQQYASLEQPDKDRLAMAINDAKSGLDATVTLRSMLALDTINGGKAHEYMADTYDAAMHRSIVITELGNLTKNPDAYAALWSRFGASNVRTPELLATAIKFNPSLKGQFFEYINVGLRAGYSIQSILSGTTSSLDAHINTAEIDKMITEKLKALQTTDLSKCTPEQKKAIEQMLHSYEQSPEIAIAQIKKVSESLFVNLGRNANSIGVGQTYEMFIHGLTLGWGVGLAQGGQTAGGITLHYGDSFRIADTENGQVRGHAGAGVSYVKGFIPFVDGGVDFTNKISVFGPGGIQDVNTKDISIMLTKGGGVLTFSKVDDRLNGVEQYADRMHRVMSMIAANVGPDRLTSENLKKVLLASGFNSDQIGSMQLDVWAEKVNTVLTQYGAMDGNALQKYKLLSGLVESEAEKIKVDLANNDKDHRSLAGFSLGIGVFGTTVFPVGGLVFTEHSIQYAESGAHRSAAKMNKGGSTEKLPTSSSKKVSESVEKIAQGIDLNALDASNIAELMARVHFILRSRGDTGKTGKAFADFQRQYMGADKGTKPMDISKAQSLLAQYLADEANSQPANSARRKDASAILTLIENTKGNQDSRVLETILALINAETSGSMYSRRIGSMLRKNPEEFGKEITTDQFNKHFLQEQKVSAAQHFGTEFDDLYTQGYFDKGSISSLKPHAGMSMIGSIHYDQIDKGKGTGAAKGLAPVIGGMEVFGTPVLVNNKSLMMKTLLDEFTQSERSRIAATTKLLGIDEEQLRSVLEGKTVKKSDGTEISLKGETQIYKVLSCLDNATCFNAVAYMEVPDIQIKRPPQPGQPPEGSVVSISLSNADFGRGYDMDVAYSVLGISGYSRPDQKQGVRDTTPGERETPAISTTPDANNTSTAGNAINKAAPAPGQSTTQTLKGGSFLANSGTQAPTASVPPVAAKPGSTPPVQGVIPGGDKFGSLSPVAPVDSVSRAASARGPAVMPQWVGATIPNPESRGSIAPNDTNGLADQETQIPPSNLKHDWYE